MDYILFLRANVDLNANPEEVMVCRGIGSGCLFEELSRFHQYIIQCSAGYGICHAARVGGDDESKLRAEVVAVV